LHRMAIGHHLGDRAHVIERSLNSRSGEEERKQDFINLDESDAASFDREWKQRTRQPAHGIKDRHRSNVRALAGAGMDHCQLSLFCCCRCCLKPMKKPLNLFFIYFECNYCIYAETSHGTSPPLPN